MKACTLRTALGAALASVVLLMTGCGGGGGGSSSSSGSGTTTPVVKSPTVSLGLTVASSGSSTNSLTLGNPVNASATVLDANSNPVANRVVTFAATPTSLAAITPTAATALTNDKGVATVQLAPASISVAGAGTLTATAKVNDVDIVGSTGFSIGTASINLSGMTVGKNPLSAYGTTSVSVNVTGVATSYPVAVNFTSICASAGKATITASTTSVNGVATANYKDNNCASVDTISASVSGTTIAATTSLNVASPGASSIQFVSASPETIVLKGTGASGLQEASLVKFKVVDNNNQPIPNSTVTLDLSTRSGGILLDNSASAITKQTDANGEVQTSVQSGSVPTPVWVSASVVSGGTTFSTQSIKLTISTGRPVQDRMSLASSPHNIEGLSYDGEEAVLTIRASDRLGNPVPDGTFVNFISSGGQVQPSCQIVGGKCEVKLLSSSPRPTNGRVAVVAYALGEESFFDSNGNNFFDIGEPFNDLGNLFVDNNANQTFDAGSEQQIQFNANNKSVCVNQTTNWLNKPSVPSTCDALWGTAHVRDDTVIVFSGSRANISPTSFPSETSCTETITFNLYDNNNNPMPSGTKISIPGTPVVKADISNPSVPDSTAIGGTSHTIAISKPAETGSTVCKAGYKLPINVTTPNGEVTTLVLERAATIP